MVHSTQVCGHVGHRQHRARISFGSTNAAQPFGCPTRRSQIAIEPAAPRDVSLPAIAVRPLVNTASGTVRLGSMAVPGQTETSRYLRVTSGSPPVTDINLGQIARQASRRPNQTARI